MKKISFLLLMTLSVFVFNSCGDDAEGTQDINYVSFGKISSNISVEKNSSTSIDIPVYTTQITGSDRTFNVYVTDATTLDPLSYNVPSTVVVPAKSNEGIISVTFSDVNLGEAIESFQLAFEPKSDVLFGSNVNTNIQKKCPLEGISDLVGSFSVTSGSTSLENDITTELDGENLKISNMGTTIMTGWWGEEITDGGTCIMNVGLTTGKLTIPRQYFMTTLYDGELSTYEIEGSGIWNNCGASPTLKITYDIYYAGDASGIGNDYAGVLWGGLFTKD